MSADTKVRDDQDDVPLSKRPHVRVCQENGSYLFRVTEWESITHALESNPQPKWYEGESVFGNTVRVRVDTITDVAFMSADAIAAIEEDRQRTDTDREPWE